MDYEKNKKNGIKSVTRNEEQQPVKKNEFHQNPMRGS